LYARHKIIHDPSHNGLSFLARGKIEKNDELAVREKGNEGASS